jgi:hypothetical protein
MKACVSDVRLVDDPPRNPGASNRTRPYKDDRPDYSYTVVGQTKVLYVSLDTFIS